MAMMDSTNADVIVMRALLHRGCDEARWAAVWLSSIRTTPPTWAGKRPGSSGCCSSAICPNNAARASKTPSESAIRDCNCCGTEPFWIHIRALLHRYVPSLYTTGGYRARGSPSLSHPETAESAMKVPGGISHRPACQHLASKPFINPIAPSTCSDTAIGVY